MSNNIIPKSEREIEAMRTGGKILGRVLHEVGVRTLPGVKIKDLNDAAERMIREAGGEPAFLGYRGFPAALCVSVNDEVVHGSGVRDRILQEGDIAGLDVGVRYGGMIVDGAITVGVGIISKEAKRLICVARDALQRALEQVHEGTPVGDVSAAVQAYVEREGFGVVRDMVGHGVGHDLHEPPEVPNFGTKGTGPALVAGCTIAIEPMITAGDWRVKTLKDGWTVATVDGSLSSHFEHTVLVTEKGCEILTKQ